MSIVIFEGLSSLWPAMLHVKVTEAEERQLARTVKSGKDDIDRLA